MRTKRHLNCQLSHSRRAYRQDDYRRKVEIAISKGLGRMDVTPYRPWISVAFSSKGFVTRHPDPVTGFAIHALSSGESDWVRTLLSLPGHLGLFSQVALPRQDTMRIAKEMGRKYPFFPDHKTPLVMTTDLVQVRWDDGKRKLFAYSVKKAPNLPEVQVRKLEIEGAYWRELGVPWRLVYRTDAPQNRIRNYRWFENYLPTSPLIPFKARWREIERVLYPLVNSDLTLAAACEKADAILSLPEGASLSQVRFYLCSRIWSVDLDVIISSFRPLVLLERNLGAL